MEKIQTKQQQRASYALECLTKDSSEVDKELATFIVGMPNMILSNGIGQTMAFLLAKKKDKMGKVFDILKKWLQNEMPVFKDATDNLSFLKKFNSISQSEYLKAQQECLRLVEWLKRYARAFQAEDKK